eukprot:sb/3461838/
MSSSRTPEQVSGSESEISFTQNDTVVQPVLPLPTQAETGERSVPSDTIAEQLIQIENETVASFTSPVPSQQFPEIVHDVINTVSVQTTGQDRVVTRHSTPAQFLPTPEDTGLAIAHGDHTLPSQTATAPQGTYPVPTRQHRSTHFPSVVPNQRGTDHQFMPYSHFAAPPRQTYNMTAPVVTRPVPTLPATFPSVPSTSQEGTGQAFAPHSNLGAPPLQPHTGTLPSRPNFDTLGYYNMHPLKPDSVTSNTQGIHNTVRPPKRIVPIFRTGGDFEIYLSRFQLYLQQYGWTGSDMFDHLLESIQCDIMYSTLALMNLRGYSDPVTLVRAVREALHPTEQRMLLKREMRFMRQWEGETVEQFSQRIRRSAGIAFAGETTSPAAGEVMFDSLVQGLSNRNISKRVLMSGATQFQSAVDLAMRADRVERLCEWDHNPNTRLGEPVFRVTTQAGSQPQANIPPPTQETTLLCQLCAATGHLAGNCPVLTTLRSAATGRRSDNRQRDQAPTRPRQAENRTCDGQAAEREEQVASLHYSEILGRYNTRDETREETGQEVTHEATPAANFPPSPIQPQPSQKKVLVNATVQGKTATCLLDTGSAATLVSSIFIASLGILSEIRDSNLALRSFTGDPIPILGTIKLPIELAGRSFFQQLIVVEGPMDCEILIGHDFLTAFGAQLDYRRRRLAFSRDNWTQFLNKPGNVTRPLKIKCNSTYTIPANSIGYLKGSVSQKTGKWSGLIEPLSGFSCDSGVLVANAVVNTHKGTCPVKLINVQDHSVTIRRGQVVATLSPIPGQQSLSGVSVIHSISNNPNTPPSSQHDETPDMRQLDPDKWTKEELFNRLKLDQISTPMSENEREQLQSLIWENRSVFSYNEFDIGCSNIYTADIRLQEGAVPSWTNPHPHSLQVATRDGP